MKMSVLALDYFSDVLGDDLLKDSFDSYYFKNYKDLYFRPDSIIKSSVGEFYDKNMEFFFKTSHKLCLYVNEHLTDKYSKAELLDVVCSILPLGTLTERAVTTALTNDFLLYHEGKNNVLSEIQSILKEINYKHNWVNHNDFVDYYRNKTNNIEKASHAICARYAPQVDVGDVFRVNSDSAFLTEYIIADILYPWVTHPLKQLRMLIPSLPSDIRVSLMKDYVGDLSVVGYPNPGHALDVGYSFIYDIISDFSTYKEFKDKKSKYPNNFKRQFWTPFFGFNNYSVFSDITDDSLKKDIETCIKNSHTLYIEILKTVGLKYEAQYAVLHGFRGRFCVSSNLFGLLDTLDVLDSYAIDKRLSYNATEVLEVIKKDVIASTPFVKETGILERYKKGNEDNGHCCNCSKE